MQQKQKSNLLTHWFSNVSLWTSLSRKTITALKVQGSKRKRVDTIKEKDKLNTCRLVDVHVALTHRQHSPYLPCCQVDQEDRVGPMEKKQPSI